MTETHVAAPPHERPRRGDTMNRFEVKYFVATKAVPALLAEIAEYTRPDPHADPEHGYQVYSVYWDTTDFAFFWEKIEGVKYRRKLRFRRYGGSPEIFIEVKQREDRTLHKRRLRWPVDRVLAVFGDGSRGLDWDAVPDDPVATEVALMIERFRLRPRMAITYRRRPLFGAFDPELRVTFDGRIQYHPSHFDLTRPFEVGRYVLDPRVTVLEVKYDHRAPVWLTKTVCRHGLKIVRMSKYCSAVDRYYFGGQNT
ncbi:MAG TPA: polyphosphate polymerase domain-containing protein [Gemmatimonadales bacterium]|nr:polyphosphate polymerase domain-containing protein [Gemmatimonadales bacterium]